MEELLVSPLWGSRDQETQIIFPKVFSQTLLGSVACSLHIFQSLTLDLYYCNQQFVFNTVEADNSENIPKMVPYT